MKRVRTRFAPSPTGFLHVGGVRTAIYAYLLAKRYQGDFILRIEDTDQERLVPGSIRAILEDLKWFGITVDEGPSKEELEKISSSWEEYQGIGGKHGPYIQSLRLPRYKEVAEQLIKEGFAYRCDCTSEKLEAERNAQMARKEPPGYSGFCRDRAVSSEVKHVVRFKVPKDKEITLQDAVKGEIKWQSLALRDTVLLKSDGFPTYHLAVVIDDHDMEISHVLRGDEWVPSAPIHLLIYEALGWEKPIFAHLPVVLGTDGKKLSKRHGATGVSNFEEQGYLPEALFNFLTLIGWAPGDGDNQEIFSIEELKKVFSIEQIHSSPGVFSYEKLNWMNGHYIRSLSLDALKEKTIPYLKKEGLNFTEEKLDLILPHIQERMHLLTEAAGLIDFLFKDIEHPDFKPFLVKGITPEIAKNILHTAFDRLKNLSEFSIPNIEASLRPIVEEVALSVGPVFTLIRIAVTGKKITPPLFESIHALGQEESCRRIELAMSKVS